MKGDQVHIILRKMYTTLRELNKDKNYYPVWMRCTEDADQIYGFPTPLNTILENEYRKCTTQFKLTDSVRGVRFNVDLVVSRIEDETTGEEFQLFRNGKHVNVSETCEFNSVPRCAYKSPHKESMYSGILNSLSLAILSPKDTEYELPRIKSHETHDVIAVFARYYPTIESVNKVETYAHRTETCSITDIILSIYESGIKQLAQCVDVNRYIKDAFRFIVNTLERSELYDLDACYYTKRLVDACRHFYVTQMHEIDSIYTEIVLRRKGLSGQIRVIADRLKDRVLAMITHIYSNPIGAHAQKRNAEDLMEFQDKIRMSLWSRISLTGGLLVSMCNMNYYDMDKYLDFKKRKCVLPDSRTTDVERAYREKFSVIELIEDISTDTNRPHGEDVERIVDTSLLVQWAESVNIDVKTLFYSQSHSGFGYDPLVGWCDKPVPRKGVNEIYLTFETILNILYHVYI